MAEKPQDTIERLVAAAKQRFQNLTPEQFAGNGRSLLEAVMATVEGEPPESWLLISYHYCHVNTGMSIRHYFPEQGDAETVPGRMRRQVADVIMSKIMADRSWIHDEITSYDGTITVDGVYTVTGVYIDGPV